MTVDIETSAFKDDFLRFPTSPWVFQIDVSLPVYPNPDPRWSKCLLLFALIPITVGFHPGAAQQLHAIRVLRAGVDQGATDVVEDLGRGNSEFKRVVQLLNKPQRFIENVSPC